MPRRDHEGLAEQHRRATDYLPFSEMVTRGNLDDRLETLNTKSHDHLILAKERWEAHRAVHEAVAESLRDYKRDANEWRATLADLRGTFLPKNEFQSEHRALEAKLHGEIVAALGLLNQLDTRVDAIRDDVKTVGVDLKAGLEHLNVEREARRGLFSDTRTIILLAIAVIGIVLAISDRLPR